MIPREEITPEDAARGKRITRLYFTAILLLSAMFTMYIWLYTKIVEIKLRIQTLNKTIENLESSNRDIKAKTTEFEAIDTIAQKAKNELGMVEPGKPIYIKLPQNWKKIYGQ